MKLMSKKIGMTQVWKENRVVPVTVLELSTEEGFEVLKEGNKVRISGKSKGRGFQGVVKRHGFHGGPKSHGQKDRHRAPGSIGATAPQRVIKGRKMAGRMGMQKTTLKHLKIEEVKKDEKLISVRGAIPGMRGTLVEIRV